MGAGALVPGYETLGWLAPAIVVTGRLIQGFSAGVELGGVSVYLSEIATPGHKGFYVSWQSGSQQIAVIFVALLGVWLSTLIPPDEMMAWGWRIPFLVGCLIIPLIFMLRRSMQETEEFLERQRGSHHPTPKEIVLALVHNWRIVTIGMLMVTMTTVSFYFITAYTPTFGKEGLDVMPRTPAGTRGFPSGCDVSRRHSETRANGRSRHPGPLNRARLIRCFCSSF